MASNGNGKVYLDPEGAHPERPLFTPANFIPLVGDNLYEYGTRAAVLAHAALKARYGPAAVDEVSLKALALPTFMVVEPVLRMAAKFDRHGGD